MPPGAPRFVGVDDVKGGIDEASTVLDGPVVPAELFQLLAEQAVDHGQVHHVAGGVVDQFRCQWPEGPVGPRVRLVDVDVQQGLHEAGIAHLRWLAHQRGGDLGVEQGIRQALVAHPGHLHVLLGRVHDPQAAPRAQEVPDGARVHVGQLVHAEYPVAGGDLGEAEARRKLRGADEFRVERDQVFGSNGAARVSEAGLLIDEDFREVEDWHKREV